MERLPFEFVGTKTAPLSIDPAEYKGMTTPQVTREIMKLLREIEPGVSFFEDDATLAAEQVVAVNGGR